MNTAPNETVVSAQLVEWKPAADGYGGDVVLDVLANESPARERDFIRPEAGKRVTAFCPPALQPQVTALLRRRVRARMTFLGGPTGSRAVLQDIAAG
jgi:hypothetical protein